MQPLGVQTIQVVRRPVDIVTRCKAGLSITSLAVSQRVRTDRRPTTGWCRRNTAGTAVTLAITC